jgi:hypothetical protein
MSSLKATLHIVVSNGTAFPKEATVSFALVPFKLTFD